MIIPSRGCAHSHHVATVINGNRSARVAAQGAQVAHAASAVPRRGLLGIQAHQQQCKYEEWDLPPNVAPHTTNLFIIMSNLQSDCRRLQTISEVALIMNEWMLK